MSSFRCEFCEVFPRPECQCHFNSVRLFCQDFNYLGLKTSESCWQNHMALPLCMGADF